MVFINRPDLHNYTIEADVLSEGNKRKMSEVGLINQRYLIVLKGNAQRLEVTSNQELFKQDIPFKWAANVWYHLKTRVDVAKDGSGVIRAKVWKKGEPEPEAWTIEASNKDANTEGSPGIFCFAPQAQRAWIDNIAVSPNK
jgi:outer membrane protein assembly factor BamB